MPAPSDSELLTRWQQHETEAAFRTLVERYAGLVYKAALRTCGDAQIAAEASQSTFITLAGKAGTLAGRDSLAGWLHVTAMLHAKNLSSRHEREQRKRERLEQHLDVMSAEQPLSGWRKLEPVLDEALAALSKGDREAILLRHYRALSMREIAASLSISAEAAQKRVDRAMERLRAKLGSRIGSTSLAAALTTGLTHDAEAGVPISSSLATSALHGAKVAGASAFAFLPLLFSMKNVAVALVVLLLLGAGFAILSSRDGWDPAPAGSIAAASQAAGSNLTPVDQTSRPPTPVRRAIQELEANYGVQRTKQARTTAEVILRQAALSAEIFENLMEVGKDSFSLYAVLAMRGDLRLSPEQRAAADKIAGDFMFRQIARRRSGAEKLSSNAAPLMELLLASDACSKQEIGTEDFLAVRTRVNNQVKDIDDPVAKDYVQLILPAINNPLLDPAFVKEFRDVLDTPEQHALLDQGVKTAAELRKSSSYGDLEPTDLGLLEAKTNANLLVMEGLAQFFKADAELEGMPLRNE